MNNPYQETFGIYREIPQKDRSLTTQKRKFNWICQLFGHRNVFQSSSFNILHCISFDSKNGTESYGLAVEYVCSRCLLSCLKRISSKSFILGDRVTVKTNLFRANKEIKFHSRKNYSTFEEIKEFVDKHKSKKLISFGNTHYEMYRIKGKEFGFCSKTWDIQLIKEHTK